jgi:hypothetical protein
MPDRNPTARMMLKLEIIIIIIIIIIYFPSGTVIHYLTQFIRCYYIT